MARDTKRLARARLDRDDRFMVRVIDLSEGHKHGWGQPAQVREEVPVARLLTQLSRLKTSTSSCLSSDAIGRTAIEVRSRRFIANPEPIAIISARERDAIDDQAAAFTSTSTSTGSTTGGCGGGWRTLPALSESRPAAPHPKQPRSGVRQPSFAVLLLDDWWQWTSWSREVMGDIGKTARPDVVSVSVQHLDGLLDPLAAYLDAVEARVAALERRLTAVPLMTAADAARYTRVNVKTILRAVRSGELPVAGHVGRSPRISRAALTSWLATKSAAAAPASPQPRRRRGRKGSDAVETAWEALG